MDKLYDRLIKKNKSRSVMLDIVCLGIANTGEFNKFLVQGLYDPRLLCSINNMVGENNGSFPEFIHTLVVNHAFESEKDAVLNYLKFCGTDSISPIEITDEILNAAVYSVSDHPFFANMYVIQNPLKFVKLRPSLIPCFSDANLPIEAHFHYFKKNGFDFRCNWELYCEFLKEENSINIAESEVPAYFIKYMSICDKYPTKNMYAYISCFIGSSSLSRCTHDSLKLENILPCCRNCYTKAINYAINYYNAHDNMLPLNAYIYFMADLMAIKQNIENMFNEYDCRELIAPCTPYRRGEWRNLPKKTRDEQIQLFSKSPLYSIFRHYGYNHVVCTKWHIPSADIDVEPTLFDISTLRDAPDDCFMVINGTYGDIDFTNLSINSIAKKHPPNIECKCDNFLHRMPQTYEVLLAYINATRCKMKINDELLECMMIIHCHHVRDTINAEIVECALSNMPNKTALLNIVANLVKHTQQKSNINPLLLIEYAVEAFNDLQDSDRIEDAKAQIHTILSGFYGISDYKICNTVARIFQRNIKFTRYT